MTKKEKAQRISEILDRLFPAVDIPLQHRDPFTLLVAVVLSAQTTDKLVNEVTPALFASASTPAALAALPVEEIKRLIRRIGLSEGKSKNLKRLSEILVAEHGGEVPRTLLELEALPGVGHKTASVVLNQGFGHATFAVDTHIHRLAARWGLSSGKNVVQTERDLKKVFPEETWGKVHLQIIYFGRQYCPALYHDLDACPICSWAASKKRKEEERRRNAGLRKRTPAS
ncbi:MAG TPA: endonuclease III [Thermoanaerobaculia bacterium]|nr:endonuclease III [Thermoanaerobaculia bacterium]